MSLDKNDIAELLLRQLQGDVDKDIDILETVRNNKEKTLSKEEKVNRYNTKKQQNYYERKNKDGMQYVNLFIMKDILSILNKEMQEKEISRSQLIHEILYSHYKNQLENKEDKNEILNITE